MRAVVVGAPMGLMDRLLRGQGWVVCIGALLAGIVYLNVTLLEVNRDIAAMSGQAEQLNRENSALRDKIAKKGTSEEIQKLAQASGFVLPAPKDVRYLTADPANDAKLAAQVASGAPVVGTTEAVADSTGVNEDAAEATGTVQPEVSEAPVSDDPVAALPEPQAEGPG